MRKLYNSKRSNAVASFTGALLGFALSYFLFYLSCNQGDCKRLVKQSFPPFEAGSSKVEIDHADHDALTVPETTKKVRLLCWVMTQPSSHKTKAIHVRNTWGRRCNILIFMSSEADYSLPAVRLKVDEGRDSLWAKTQQSFKYIHQHYMDRVDWVLKADDDTYVIVENLKMLLSQHNASEKLYLGCHFKPYVGTGYMSGGAGYVLSKAAVNAFVEEALPMKSCPKEDVSVEDLMIGICLEQVGVKIVDSRDSFGRYRFFPLDPASFVAPKVLPKSHWFWSYIYHPMKKGFDCCSDTPISFHYVDPEDMYMLEYFIYHVHPHGSCKEQNSKSTQSKAPAVLEKGESPNTASEDRPISREIEIATSDDIP